MNQWNEKVELSLDGRQIFFLFFGSAVAACLIFVAGVVVGKRIEQRALAMTPPVVEDPLAALDQIDTEEADDGLTFHEALVREERRRGPASSASGTNAFAAHAEAAAVGAHPPAAPPPAAANHAPAANPAAHAALSSPPAHPSAANAGARGPTAGHAPAVAPHAVAPAPHGATVSPHAVPSGSGSGSAAVPHAALPVAAPERFTLQLSSFATQGDADAFAEKVRGAGYKPDVVESAVPGKGTFFRVRVGDYSTRAAALAAQAEYQKTHNASAYVATY